MNRLMMEILFKIMKNGMYPYFQMRMLKQGSTKNNSSNNNKIKRKKLSSFHKEKNIVE